jgi:hypothetical protein
MGKAERESGRVGEWENGRVGEWENGRMGEGEWERENGRETRNAKRETFSFGVERLP